MQKKSAFAKWAWYIPEHILVRSNILTFMRISVCCGAILLLTTTLLTAKSGLSQDIHQSRVTFELNHESLKTALQKLQDQSGYSIFYIAPKVSGYKPITLPKDTRTVAQTLDLLLQGTNLTFKQADKSIILSEKIKKDDAPATAPNKQVRGRATDESGASLPGVTIKVIPAASAVNFITTTNAATGITNKTAISPSFSMMSTTTNANGEFSIYIDNPADMVQFSFIGFATQNLKASELPNPLVIKMKSAAGSLDEVQIIGYGTTSRRFNVGNTTSIKAEEIAKEPVGNILMALQGKIPGMSIVQVSGIPGSAPTVKIRGTTSLSGGTGTAPLYILDGVPIPDVQNAVNGSNLGANGISALEGINTADIESVDVLKDADATAIYGSRGANGVILITTKKGRPGAVAVNFNAYTGFSKVQHFVDLLDVHQYNAMRREALKNDGITPTVANSPDLLSWDTTQVHNWQKELIGGTAVANDANVSLSGGSNGTTFYANAGYHNQGTVFPGDENDMRKSARININHVSPNGKLTFGIISGYSISTLNLQGLDVTSFIYSAPAYPLYTATGAPNYSGTNGFPLAYTLQPFNSETSTYNGHATLGYEFIKGLTLKIDAGFNNAVDAQRQTNPLISLDPSQNSSGNLRTADYKNNTWIAEPQLTYNARFKKNGFNFLLGTSFQKTTTSGNTVYGTNFTNEALINNVANAGTVTYSNTDSQYAYTSVFGRLTYNYDEKYLANLSYRRDGSSRFGPNKRFGNFYAIGLGWIFTKEAFVKNTLPFLSFGKLRGSYGLIGNDQVGDYKYLATYNAAANGYQGPVLTSNGIANPDFRWEENRKLEFGLELGALKDRILFNASFFRNRTGNQLINFALPPQTGSGSYLANFPALVQNQGWEFELTTSNIEYKSFSWKTSANVALSHNKLLDFPGIEKTSYASQYIVGQSLTIQKGYVFNGLSNTGVPTYKDLTGDGSITTDDRIVLGNRDPLTGGISNDFRYKGFQLSFFIDYSRFSNYNPAVSAARSGNLGTNRTVGILSRWQKAGDELSTSTPKFTTAAATYVARNFLQSDINWANENIFRLRNIVASYNLPYSLVHKVNMQNAKVFFQAQNVWTSGDHSNLLDPETGLTTLPPLRTLTFGINFTF